MFILWISIIMCCNKCGITICMCYAIGFIYTLLATGTITAGVVFDNIGEIVGGSVATLLEAIYIILRCMCGHGIVDVSDDIIEC